MSNADSISSAHAGSFSKRATDMLGALLILPLLSPLLLLIAFAVSLDGGPVLFAHRRVGLGGREFSCLKFRTMKVDAEAALTILLRNDPTARLQWEQFRKLVNDPRITLVGRILRVTSLDELPQLLNIIRGHMSLVGPRPIVRAELDQFYGAEALSCYLSVRPGLTGLWQVAGRSELDYVKRVALDTQYVKIASMLVDLDILMRTVVVVLRRTGAS